MNKPSPSIRKLAGRLVALEAASPAATDAPMHEAARVCAQLRVSLIRFAGIHSFTALMRRAVVLARADVPFAQTVNVTAEGLLEGLDQADPETALAITTHLLGLLATFIGEPLTLRLVRETWPDASLD